MCVCVLADIYMCVCVCAVIQWGTKVLSSHWLAGLISSQSSPLTMLWWVCLCESYTLSVCFPGSETEWFSTVYRRNMIKLCLDMCVEGWIGGIHIIYMLLLMLFLLGLLVEKLTSCCRIVIASCYSCLLNLSMIADCKELTLLRCCFQHLLFCDFRTSWNLYHVQVWSK